MRKAVQQSRRHAFALKDVDPFAKGQIAGNQHAAPLAAVRKDLEQKFGSRPAEAEIAKLITY